MASSLIVEDIMDPRRIQEKVKSPNRMNNIQTMWIATNWSLWILRNNMIFENTLISFEWVCSNIMFLSWRWLGRCNVKNYVSFYDWYKCPLDSFSDV